MAEIITRNAYLIPLSRVTPCFYAVEARIVITDKTCSKLKISTVGDITNRRFNCKMLPMLCQSWAQEVTYRSK